VKQVNGKGGELQEPPGSNVSYNRVPFHMIANDGNLMEHALAFDGSVDLDGDGNLLEHKGQLPEQSVAERYDIIVDFARSGVAPGDKLYLLNTTEHQDGRKPKGKIPLADVLSKKYNPVSSSTGWSGGDPAVGMLMELRVVAYSGTDVSLNPANYTPGKKKLIPLAINRNDPRLAKAKRRTFDFGRSSGTDEAPWTVKADNGDALNADVRRVTSAVQLATGPTQAGYKAH
jgi:hypothetical protein